MGEAAWPHQPPLPPGDLHPPSPEDAPLQGKQEQPRASLPARPWALPGQPPVSQYWQRRGLGFWPHLCQQSSKPLCLQELGQGCPGTGCRPHPCICTEGVAGLWGLHLPTASGARFAMHLSPQPQFTQEPSESALALTPGREGSPHSRAPALEPGVAWRSGCALGCHCELHASSLDI